MATLQTDTLRDLAAGVPSTQLVEGAMLEGTLNGERVLLARSNGVARAIGGQCSHYGAPLAQGLLVDDTVRCPLHHACYNLRTGEAICGPALSPVPTYEVAETAGVVRVLSKAAPPARPTMPRNNHGQVRTVVILGAGAAGVAAADMLRRKGYDGRLVMVGAEPDLPYDRPNLSKDYLAGTAPEEWLPIRPRAFYEENEIELILGERVSALDPEARELRMLSGRSPKYDRLLIATGSEAVRLPVATQKLRHVFTLRTLADCRAIIAASQHAKHAVVVGSSFIGLEVAAALRTRGIGVDVVAQNSIAFDRIFGPTLSAFIRRQHEAHGVTFHLRDNVRAVDETHVTLVSGARIPADLVVVGIGVRPSVAIAQWARLNVSEGVVVDQYLETSRPGIFAAGDIARWPDARTGEAVRAEHWAVALRQGQVAAANMLGERIPFAVTPFFWSQHYDTTIQYVGHQGTWDEISVDGDPDAHDCAATFRRAGQIVGVATIGRDIASLRAELDFEREASGALGGGTVETFAIGGAGAERALSRR